ncbi:MAG: hypothetical protein ACI3VZ_03015 [Faecousia sp.]
MAELDERLNSLLSNPQLMSQIMNMAQQLGQQSQPKQPPKQDQETPRQASPMPDPGMLQAVMKLSQGGSISKEQRNLLQALSPFLSKDRISRLERAMKAARLAQTATSVFGQGGPKGR